MNHSIFRVTFRNCFFFDHSPFINCYVFNQFLTTIITFAMYYFFSFSVGWISTYGTCAIFCAMSSWNIEHCFCVTFLHVWNSAWFYWCMMKYQFLPCCRGVWQFCMDNISMGHGDCGTDALHGYIYCIFSALDSQIWNHIAHADCLSISFPVTFCITIGFFVVHWSWLDWLTHVIVSWIPN